MQRYLRHKTNCNYKSAAVFESRWARSAPSTGATRSPILGLDYALFENWLIKYTGLMIGLDQGMTYMAEESKVVYQSKDAKDEKTFDALGWPCPVK